MKKILFTAILMMFTAQIMGEQLNFWSWFSNNIETIESFQPGNEALLDEIMENLHQYNDKLYFEISTNEKVKELVITAKGDSSQFDSVKRLVASAPELKNWKIIAFRPPLGFGFTNEYEGVEYNPADLWFLPLVSKSNPELFGLRIGIPDFDPKKHEHSVDAIWILLNTGLGELKTTEEIHHVETAQLPKSTTEQGYIKFNEIDHFIEWRKKQHLTKP